MNYNECDWRWSWPNLISAFYPGICQKGQENHENIEQFSQSPVRDLNSGPPAYQQRDAIHCTETLMASGKWCNA
jgi:hypothetical protein